MNAIIDVAIKELHHLQGVQKAIKAAIEMDDIDIDNVIKMRLTIRLAICKKSIQYLEGMIAKELSTANITITY